MRWMILIALLIGSCDLMTPPAECESCKLPWEDEVVLVLTDSLLYRTVMYPDTTIYTPLSSSYYLFYIDGDSSVVVDHLDIKQ